MGHDATTTDLAPIRADEDFDHGKLADYLRANLPGVAGEIEVLQFPGGHSNLTYLARMGGAEYVVRRPPLGPVAPKAHDMGREFKILSRLWAVFPPAPRALLFCEDASIIGAPFVVMERREGTVIRGTWPAALPDEPDFCRRVSESLIDTLADLHRVDYKAAGLEDFGKPEGFVERQVKGWRDRWERAKTRELPAVDELVAWLIEKMPESPVASIIHNDYKFDNVMLDPKDPSRISSIFDWEMATIGDPMIDLGISLAYYAYIHLPGSDGRRFIPTKKPGFLGRDALLERYAARTGYDVSKIAYFEAFAMFKNAVVLEQIYVRFVKGQTQDKRFAALGPVVEPLVRMGLDLAGKSGL